MMAPEQKPTPQRSAIMRAVRAKNTTPEITVRKLLRKIAPFYRLHCKNIPGKPDIAYIGARKAIFVHGCFWHGHDCPRGARTPKSNADYWRAKIERNRVRDAHNAEILEEQGWRALIIWECELKNAQMVDEKLRRFMLCSDAPA